MRQLECSLTFRPCLCSHPAEIKATHMDQVGSLRAAAHGVRLVRRRLGWVQLLRSTACGVLLGSTRQDQVAPDLKPLLSLVEYKHA